MFFILGGCMRAGDAVITSYKVPPCRSQSSPAHFHRVLV